VGDAGDDMMPSPLDPWDSSLLLPPIGHSIHGRRLPAGVTPQVAEPLDSVDRDLALRLVNGSSVAIWWELESSAILLHERTGQARELEAPAGRLCPILVDGLGKPVAAVWIAYDQSMRWYFVPDRADWTSLIDWLVCVALPHHAPAAARRARHPAYIDPDLLTRAEAEARRQLAELDEDYARRKISLETTLQAAESEAALMRSGLLFGTGSELADAVAKVLADAGLKVTDLDRDLGATESADLLVQFGTDRRLVEVKSAGGNASEKLADFLHKHLATWPGLQPDLPVGGGVLIVNHQHKMSPHERTSRVYQRKAFVDALSFPVLSACELFTWWCAEDWQAIRDAVLGRP
jgi:hypothetical protein